MTYEYLITYCLHQFLTLRIWNYEFMFTWGKSNIMELTLDRKQPFMNEWDIRGSIPLVRPKGIHAGIWPPVEKWPQQMIVQGREAFSSCQSAPNGVPAKEAVAVQQDHPLPPVRCREVHFIAANFSDPGGHGTPDRSGRKYGRGRGHCSQKAGDNVSRGLVGSEEVLPGFPAAEGNGGPLVQHHVVWNTNQKKLENYIMSIVLSCLIILVGNNNMSCNLQRGVSSQKNCKIKIKIL